MMSSTYSVNGDASAEKFPVDTSGFVYWKMKMELFREVALRKASGRLTVTTITGSVRDTNPS